MERSITRTKVTSNKEKERPNVIIMMNESLTPVPYHKNDALVFTIMHKC